MVFLFILIILVVLLITSKIRIEINNLRFSTNNVKNNLPIKQQHLNDKYNVKIKLQILGKITVLWFNINKHKIEKLKKKQRFKNIKMTNFKKHISVDKIKQWKNIINISIEKLKLNAEIGTDSTMLTTMIIPTISSIIAIILAKKKVKQENQYFQLKPIYNKRKYV